MTDIYTHETAGLAAFEMVHALMQTLLLITKEDEIKREILITAEAAISRLETLHGEGRDPETARNAAKLIRERYPVPSAPMT